MRPGEQLLVGLDVEEEDQIMDIGAGGVNLVWSGEDERVGVGVQDGGEGIKDETRVSRGDLEGLGERGRVDPAIRRGGGGGEEGLLEGD